MPLNRGVPLIFSPDNFNADTVNACGISIFSISSTVFSHLTLNCCKAFRTAEGLEK